MLNTTIHDPIAPNPILVFQSAKFGDIPQIIAEFNKAKKLLTTETNPKRVYGISGGSLVALAYSLELMSR